MSLPAPRPPTTSSANLPAQQQPPPGKLSSKATATTPASAFTLPVDSESSDSPQVKWSTAASSLISPCNQSLQSQADASSTATAPFRTPPFLAAILAAHSQAPPVQATASSSKNVYPHASLSYSNTTSHTQIALQSNSSISQPNPNPNPSAALYTLPPAPSPPEDPLIPPENFSLVASGVYRSGFPKKKNFRYMETLKLKTVLTLVLEEYPAANLKWCGEQGIQFMQFGIPGNKEPFDNIPEDVISAALVAIIDRRNHPLLIHCNKGKHRTGCLIGCIRRLQTWSLTSIFDEYRRFSTPKSRAVDQQFIDLFDLTQVWDQVLYDSVPAAAAGGSGLSPKVNSSSNARADQISPVGQTQTRPADDAGDPHTIASSKPVQMKDSTTNLVAAAVVEDEDEHASEGDYAKFKHKDQKRREGGVVNLPEWGMLSVPRLRLPRPQEQYTGLKNRAAQGDNASTRRSRGSMTGL